jgi:hypothetical protein
MGAERGVFLEAVVISREDQPEMGGRLIAWKRDLSIGPRSVGEPSTRVRRHLRALPALRHANARHGLLGHGVIDDALHGWTRSPRGDTRGGDEEPGEDEEPASRAGEPERSAFGAAASPLI